MRTKQLTALEDVSAAHRHVRWLLWIRWCGPNLIYLEQNNETAKNVPWNYKRQTIAPALASRTKVAIKCHGRQFEGF